MHSGESDAEHNQVRLLAMRCGCIGIRPAHRTCPAPVLQGRLWHHRMPTSERRRTRRSAPKAPFPLQPSMLTNGTCSTLHNNNPGVQAELVAQTEAEFQDLDHLNLDVKSW